MEQLGTIIFTQIGSVEAHTVPFYYKNHRTFHVAYTRKQGFGLTSTEVGDAIACVVILLCRQTVHKDIKVHYAVNYVQG